MASPLVDIARSVAPDREWPDSPDEIDALEAMLAERVARAAATWPATTVEPSRFVRAIAERLAADRPVAQLLEVMQTDDLYLACGCGDGDPAALAAFEARFGRTIARAVVASGASRAEREDLCQVVRQRLLVAPASGGAPRIATYSARGSLAAWVRVVAARETARMLPRARRERPDEDELAARIASGDDPEVGYLKRLYRDEFKRAFRVAVEALGDRERVLLAQHALDGLGIDQLAGLYRVHRATVARWLQSAREAVLAATQRELIHRLRLSQTELASVMRLIDSQLDVSLPRLLDRAAAR